MKTHKRTLAMTVAAGALASATLHAQPAPNPTPGAPEPAPNQPPLAPAPPVETAPTPPAAVPPEAPAPTTLPPAPPPQAEPNAPPSETPPPETPPPETPPSDVPPSTAPAAPEAPDAPLDAAGAGTGAVTTDQPPRDVALPPTRQGEQVVPLPVFLAEDQPEPSVTPLTVTGSFWTRYEVRENYERHPSLVHPRLHREGDRFVYRARLGLQTNPVDLGGGQSIVVKVSPQAYGVHSTGPAPETIADGYDLGVYEGFVRLQGRSLDIDVGRFRMNYGDSLVIGDLDWHEAGRAFQGGRMRFKGRSGYYTDVFATLINEGADLTGGVFEGDRYFYGVYTGVGPLLGDLDLDVYLLSQTWGSIAGDPDGAVASDQEGASFFTFGARVAQQIDLFDYRAEAGVQLGTTPVPGGNARDKLAYQADASVGITPIKKLRIGVGGLIASGDDDPTDDTDTAWDPLFPTGHKFLGLSDVFGERTNAVSGNLDVRYQPLRSLILALQGHALARLESDNASGDTYAGTEIDTHVIHPMGHGALLRAMYAVFIPSESYWAQPDPIHYLEAQFGFDF